ncbi:2Fe-2S iron-sulfur cluster-binding protein [Desertibacillus haloalkaliphilus]|uniref:2Fe-2S iron-sulfur cluster-binding protein n=1 Tax=Desertibacillus haloalkaliphilus TaxID=1328930 RepID=UPI001C260681|nr:2Fe-2S iron-sulfur cluster-binding protein [Desertibacillus haloalkaliphilus]MBU8908240.1 (2Fe-2S)-binding protein [Desertibacillus haloalkaliphilus]
MPKVKLQQNDLVYEQQVEENSNLVVLAGIKKFPHLKYGCGMGKCTKCVSKIVSGADQLGEPNWKEKKMLGDKLEEGYRLTCQLTITSDIELTQE